MPFEVAMAIEKQNRQNSLGNDQIPAELVKSGDRKFCVIFIILKIRIAISRNFLQGGNSRSLCIFLRKMMKNYSNYRGIPNFAN